MAQHFEMPDKEINTPPTDGISCLSWSPKGYFLAASSWDTEVRIWQVSPGDLGSVPAPNKIKHDAPALSCCWSGDGSKVFSGGCDSKARVMDVMTGQGSILGQHAAPIKSVFWMDDNQLLATGSWDKTIKYWDGRQQNPVFSVNVPERIWAMDICRKLCVVGTANKKVILYDLNKPGVEYQTLDSPLEQQTRVISCFNDASGYAIASIEGRCAIRYVEAKDQQQNFAFKCHREQIGNTEKVYAVNVVSFNSAFNQTFTTAGSDGVLNFWDKESRIKLKTYKAVPQPISAGAFSADTKMYAIGVSYDWSQGHEHVNPNLRSTIMLHSVTEADIKPRKASATTNRR